MAKFVPSRDLGNIRLKLPVEHDSRNAGKQGFFSRSWWSAAPGRAGFGHGLSLYAVAPHRAALPAPAELLGIRRRGDRPLRALGRWMDGSRPHPALPPLGNSGTGFRARCPARRIALVHALALWALERPQ